MKPKVGHIQFLNCLPLYHMLVKNGIVSDHNITACPSGSQHCIDLFKDTPVALCRRLLEGALDISPIPAIEYARHSDKVLLLPDLTVSSNGRVMSIVIVSKVPLQELDGKPVALTNTSATSQVLTKIILREKYNIDPFFFESPPDLPEMFREAQAALLIGDDALRVCASPNRYLLYDLGEEWKQLTGEKMVYAVWAVRRNYALQHPELVSMVFRAFLLSRDMSLECLDEIAEETARWEPFSIEYLCDYFQTLNFSFGSEYQQGLRRYFSMAEKTGALNKAPELEFAKILQKTSSEAFNKKAITHEPS